MILTKTLHFSAASTVAVQREDRGPFMHEVIIEANSDDVKGYNNWLLRVRIVGPSGRGVG